jgi:hypothetical protein
MHNQNTTRPTAYFLEDDDLLRSLGKEALRLELPDSWNLEDFASLNELKQANARTQGKIIVSDWKTTTFSGRWGKKRCAWNFPTLGILKTLHRSMN